MSYYYVIYGLPLFPAFSCYLSLSIFRMLQGKITDELCCLNNPYWTPRLVKRFQKNSAKIVFIVIFSFYRHFSYWLFFCSVSVLHSGMNFTRFVAMISISLVLLLKKQIWHGCHSLQISSNQPAHHWSQMTTKLLSL